MNGISDTSPKSLKFNSQGDPLVHSKGAAESGSNHIGFMVDGLDGM